MLGKSQKFIESNFDENTVERYRKVLAKAVNLDEGELEIEVQNETMQAIEEEPPEEQLYFESQSEEHIEV